MTGLVIFLSSERLVRPWLRTVCLVTAVSLSFVLLSTAEASVALKAILLPQTVTRSVIVDKSQWQGVAVELERLHSPATLAATLEQLATLLPELTPVWSELGVMQAHWTSAEASYALWLWETQSHATEGLLSGLALTQPLGLGHSALPAQFEARDWLPKQAQPLFRLLDQSGAQPIALSSFTVSTTSSQLVDQLKAYGRRKNWVGLPDELTFFRHDKRLSFKVMTDTGQTMVLVYETFRGAP